MFRAQNLGYNRSTSKVRLSALLNLLTLLINKAAPGVNAGGPLWMYCATRSGSSKLKCVDSHPAGVTLAQSGMETGLPILEARLWQFSTLRCQARGKNSSS